MPRSHLAQASHASTCTDCSVARKENMASTTSVYTAPGDRTWKIVFDARGDAFCEFNDGEKRAATREYMNKAWYNDPQDMFQTLEIATPSFKDALSYLATTILPWWEDVVMPRHSALQRKYWSYDGEYVLCETNRVHDLAIRCALRVRRFRGLPSLPMVESFGKVKRGDIIEGILGLAYNFLLPISTQQHVVAACLCVKAAWDMPHLRGEWDSERVVDHIVVNGTVNDFFGAWSMTIHPGPHERRAYAAWEQRQGWISCRLWLATKLRNGPQRIVFAFLR